MLTSLGSANNKAKTLGMEHIKRRKFTEKNEKEKHKVEEIQLANLARASFLVFILRQEYSGEFIPGVSW